ncbi:unnamed protein product, partial [Laminaria digitata]
MAVAASVSVAASVTSVASATLTPGRAGKRGHFRRGSDGHLHSQLSTRSPAVGYSALSVGYSSSGSPGGEGSRLSHRAALGMPRGASSPLGTPASTRHTNGRPSPASVAATAAAATTAMSTAFSTPGGGDYPGATVYNSNGSGSGGVGGGGTSDGPRGMGGLGADNMSG